MTLTDKDRQKIIARLIRYERKSRAETEVQSQQFWSGAGYGMRTAIYTIFGDSVGALIADEVIRAVYTEDDNAPAS